MDERSMYRTPLSARYASPEMSHNFSDKKKFRTWRLLWVYMAKCQKVLIIAHAIIRILPVLVTYFISYSL